MSRILLIDDTRLVKADMVCKTYEEGLRALIEEKWDTVYIDYDLEGDKTGYDILNGFISSGCNKRPGNIIVTTANKKGKQEINIALMELGYTYIRDRRINGVCSRSPGQRDYKTKFLVSEYVFMNTGG